MELKPLQIFCKINDILMTTEGEGCIVFSKRKHESLEKTLRLLKNFKDCEVTIVIFPGLKDFKTVLEEGLTLESTSKE
jgi:hypothetical protein